MTNEDVYAYSGLIEILVMFIIICRIGIKKLINKRRILDEE